MVWHWVELMPPGSLDGAVHAGHSLPYMADMIFKVYTGILSNNPGTLLSVSLKAPSWKVSLQPGC